MADRKVLEFNGTVFERTIMKYLQSHYPTAVILHDRELYSDFLGKPTQFDLVMIHEKGVFVIEAKSWRRWIRGSQNEDKWSGMGSITNVMDVFSPVNQNFIHIRTLRNAIRRELNEEPVLFNNVVCLPDETVLDTDCENVVHLSRLGLWIDKAMIKDNVTIDPQEYRQWIEAVTIKGRDRSRVE